MVKKVDNSNSYATSSTATDLDYEKYSLTASYKAKVVEAGVGLEYRRLAQNKRNGAAVGYEIPAFQPYYAQSYAVAPYAKAKFGPVKIEAEAAYAWGKGEWEEDTNAGLWSDLKIENMSAYINVLADFKMVYAGATFAYVSGDDPGTIDKIEGGIAKGGKDFNPALIMFNYERGYWAGGLSGYSYSTMNNTQYVTGTGTTDLNNEMINVWFFQGLVGVRPLAALDINATVSFANADKKPNGVLNNAHQ